MTSITLFINFLWILSIILHCSYHKQAQKALSKSGDFNKKNTLMTDIFSGHFSHSSSPGTPIMGILACVILSQMTLKLSSSLFILFCLFVFCLAAVISTSLSSDPLIHSFVSFSLVFILLVYFSFTLLHSLILLGWPLYFIIVCWKCMISHSVHLFSSQVLYLYCHYPDLFHQWVSYFHIALFFRAFVRNIFLHHLILSKFLFIFLCM